MVILVECNDLVCYFIIFVVLELMGEVGMFLVIGEFKEFMDRGLGGFGYSFVDLVVDMVGVEFVKVVNYLDYVIEV